MMTNKIKKKDELSSIKFNGAIGSETKQVLVKLLNSLLPDDDVLIEGPYHGRIRHAVDAFVAAEDSERITADEVEDAIFGMKKGSGV